jgi:hypothetical protein
MIRWKILHLIITNITKGRLEGKSMGLKAILLFAKNQGINIAA